MPECDCDGIDHKFDEAYAAEKLEAYRSHGPDPSTRALIDAISAEDVRGLTLLDIGAGVGAEATICSSVTWRQPRIALFARETPAPDA